MGRGKCAQRRSERPAAKGMAVEFLALPKSPMCRVRREGSAVTGPDGRRGLDSGHLSGDGEMGGGPNTPTGSRNGGWRMADVGMPASPAE